MRMHGRQNEKKKKNDEFFFRVYLLGNPRIIARHHLRWKWRYVRREECFSLLANVS